MMPIEHRGTSGTPTQRIVSYSLPCTGVSLLQFLAIHAGGERFYWENAHEPVAFAGSGIAVELTAWGEDRFSVIETELRRLFADLTMLSDSPTDTYPRVFGGFAFRHDFTPDNTWSIYAPAHFVLPHYQLVSINGETWLTINTQLPYDEDPHSLGDDLKVALEAKIQQLQKAEPLPIGEQPPLDHIAYPMTYEAWETMLNHAIQRIRAGELKKVVLSRVAEASLNEPVNLLAILDYLKGNYAECYRFLFEPRTQYAYYGATPELLVDVRGDQLTSMGLAGSIRRGESSEEDAELAQALLNSTKDRHEHQLVVDKMRDRLEPLAQSLDIGDVGIYTLSNIQHLHTPIHATLKSSGGVLPLVSLLHPTPALGGDPRDIAMQLISESEPVPRGWYAAPVGWVDYKMDGQFAVTIRSAVAQEKRVWMYAGAGIVADSEPQKEWDEIALKFRPMLSALGVLGAGQNQVLSAEY